MQGAPASSSTGIDAEAVALSSLAWTPDGSGVAVMDSCGRLALLDVHGATYSIQLAVRLGQQPAQVAHVKHLLALALKGHKQLIMLPVQQCLQYNVEKRTPPPASKPRQSICGACCKIQLDVTRLLQCMVVCGHSTGCHTHISHAIRQTLCCTQQRSLARRLVLDMHCLCWHVSLG